MSVPRHPGSASLPLAFGVPAGVGRRRAEPAARRHGRQLRKPVTGAPGPEAAAVRRPHGSQPPQNERGWLAGAPLALAGGRTPRLNFAGSSPGAARRAVPGGGTCGPRARTGSGRRHHPPSPPRGERRTLRHAAGCTRPGGGRGPGARANQGGRTGARPRELRARGRRHHPCRGFTHGRAPGPVGRRRPSPPGRPRPACPRCPARERRLPAAVPRRAAGCAVRGRPCRRFPGRGTPRAAAGSAAPGARVPSSARAWAASRAIPARDLPARCLQTPGFQAQYVQARGFPAQPRRPG